MKTHQPPTDMGTRDQVLAVVQAMVREMNPGLAERPVSMDSRLEQDLGFDSLSRVELLTRLEQTFACRISEAAFLEAETPGDLLQLMGKTSAFLASTTTEAEIRKTREAFAQPPAHIATLTDLLAWHARENSQRVHIHLYETGEILTYGDLYREALLVAAGFRRKGLEPGQNVGLMLLTGREFFTCFFGCLLAGGIPVPLYPPARMSQLVDHLNRQTRILENAGAVLLVSFEQAKPFTRLLQGKVAGLREVCTVPDLADGIEPLTPVPLEPGQTAFIQYTSGSTGTPKGVVLSHFNLLSNIRAMANAVRITDQDVFVSWLPLYHDMGLIGAWLGTLYSGALLVLMPPQAFLARPERWLQAIHEFRGTLSASPNFGYELCLRKIKDDDLNNLDLRCWRLALNGAEPVSPRTMEQFHQRFGPVGFRAEAMAPVYGLAECSVGLAFPPLGRKPLVEWLDRTSLTAKGQALAVPPVTPHAITAVGCGLPLPGHQIRVIDALGFEVPERVQGRIQFRGPSATTGYFQNPTATATLYHEDWLNTGDLGYIAGGEVFLTGRQKDVIIRAGRNLYPQELEEAVGNLPGLRAGCVVAFACPDPSTGTERLVLVAETREAEAVRLEEIRTQIQQLSLQLLDSAVDEIVLTPPQTVLKTSSGKLRRAATRDAFLQGVLLRPTRLWQTKLSLAAWSLFGRLQNGFRLLGGFAFGILCWLSLAVGLTAAFPILLVLPTLPSRQRFAHYLGRAILGAAVVPVRVNHLERISGQQPLVFVSNHASYLDALILAASLPLTISFTAKKELAANFLVRVMLQRIGVELLDRFDFQQSLEDVNRLEKLAQTGQHLLFFPEGTFTREPGLRHFHLGAFKIAAEAGLSVVPVALHGTRSMLRDEQWLPHRSRIQVTIGEPIQPQGTSWSATVALREAARQAILQHCGEPDLRISHSLNRGESKPQE
ncbi:MAG: AMP-binding protein [Blastocatellia bacterium]|nr:AMP-binding protein [Blastocatellia bacterium]